MDHLLYGKRAVSLAEDGNAVPEAGDAGLAVGHLAPPASVVPGQLAYSSRPQVMQVPLTREPEMTF